MLGIGGIPRGAGQGPGRGIVTDKRCPVPARSSRRRLRGGVSVKAAPRTQADKQANGQIGESQVQLDGIVPGVESEGGRGRRERGRL